MAGPGLDPSCVFICGHLLNILLQGLEYSLGGFMKGILHTTCKPLNERLIYNWYEATVWSL